MVSNITDSGVDFAYDMPESIVAALGSQGFAEAARAFQSIAGDEVPAAMRSQISLVIPQAERVVTTDDVQKEIDEFILRVGASSGSLVDQARAMLSGLVGKPYSSLTGMASALERLTSLAQSANSLSDPETPEARLLAIQNQINDIYENQRRLLDEALRNGTITQEEYDRAYAAIDKAQHANNTYGAGSDEAQRANADAAKVIDPIANNMDHNQPGSGDELRRNQADIRRLDNQAGDIYAGLVSQSRDSTLQENRNDALPANHMAAENGNTVEAATVAPSALFGPAPAENRNNLENNQYSAARLAYADTPEGQFVPSQPTPGAGMNSGTVGVSL